MEVGKWRLHLAGEYAVAAELCRRNFDARFTSGDRKRLNLVVFEDKKAVWNITVATKQQDEWPACKGVSAPDSILVLVDFANRKDTDRPDFYILTAQDWRALAMITLERYREKHPDRRIEITDENVIVFVDEVNEEGHPYKGFGVSPEDIQTHHEAWHKFAQISGE